MKQLTDFITKVLTGNKNDPAFIIEKLYRSVNGCSVSHSERERLQINDTSFTYGEIVYQTLSDILAIIQPGPDEIIYDLGSGTGKAIISAALLYPWKKCVGIEYLPGLYETSQKLLQHFLVLDEVQQHFSHQRVPIEFILADFLTIDFSDADIIYMNATTFNPVLWGKLTEKLQALKQGAHVIVTSKKMDESHFEKKHQALHPMSWGDCTVFIYQKK